jgi:hypothetical protein
MVVELLELGSGAISAIHFLNLLFPMDFLTI